MILSEDATVEGFVINPYGENIPFSRSLIESLREQKAQHAENASVTPFIVEKDTPVQLGVPREYPEALVRTLTAHFKKQKAVQAAYLQLMVREGEESYLIVVDFTGDQRSVFDAIASVARPHLNGKYLDLIPLDSDFGQSAVRHVAPFYKRKRGFLFG